MTIYVTRNSKYEVTKIGELEAISANKGQNMGKPYGVVGFLDDDTPIEVIHVNNNLLFYSTRNMTKEYIEYDDLPRFLEKTAERGKRIVARLLTEEGKLSRVGMTPMDIMVTSGIQDILD